MGDGLTDRRNDLVISGGVNIYPAKIEAQLVRAKAPAIQVGQDGTAFGRATKMPAILWPNSRRDFGNLIFERSAQIAGRCAEKLAGLGEVSSMHSFYAR